jgi:hypothetical protein
LQRGTEVVVKRLAEEGVEITHGWVGAPPPREYCRVPAPIRADSLQEIDLMFHCCRESALPAGASAAADGSTDGDSAVAVRAAAAAGAGAGTAADHYDVLSLPHDFTPDELKRACARAYSAASVCTWWSASRAQSL